MSILYALGDEHTRSTILRIHSEGVQAAADYLQENAGWARQLHPRRGRRKRSRQAGHAQFVHRTARPVTDPSTGRVTVDPQLHTHVTVPTWVQRPDGSWSQLYSEALYQHAAAAGAIAQAEWRDRLVRELGISTVVDGKGCFSIVGITDAQRREFSRRTQQIEALERQLGIDSRTDTSSRWCRRARARTRSPPPRTSSPNGESAPPPSGSTPRSIQTLAGTPARGVVAAPARRGAQHGAARRAWAHRSVRDLHPS